MKITVGHNPPGAPGLPIVVKTYYGETKLSVREAERLAADLLITLNGLVEAPYADYRKQLVAGIQRGLRKH